MLGEELGVERIDRLWLFPPLRRGRKEWGLVVVGTFVGGDGGRRRMHTARYTAERTGRGLSFEPSLAEEGTLPPGRIERVVSGVVRRNDDDPGDPRTVAIEGDRQRFRTLLEEVEPSHREAWQT